MGNINGPMNLHISGAFEKAFSPILLKTHLLYNSHDFFVCELCMLHCYQRGKEVRYQDSRFHLYI